ncbi:Biopolymer transport protein ExbD/TolR [Minicystis rosea]|nr:Biopolymer transport protein ExbD/TolR [Minicystis rosea]
MAGTMQSGGRGRAQGITGINVTPMVDVVLVLLVIMMVSAQYIVSQSLKVELPKSQSTDEQTASIAAVTVAKGGGLYFNQEQVDEKSLVAKLRGAVKQNPEISLIVSADRSAMHGDVVHVIDLAKLEGISKFAINVETPQ